MTAEELLSVLIVQVLNHEQTTNGIDECIFLGRMEMDGVRVLAIVANRVFHFDLGGCWRTRALLVLLHLNNNKTTKRFP